MRYYIILTLFLITVFFHAISAYGFNKLGTCGGIKYRKHALMEVELGGWAGFITDCILFSVLLHKYIVLSYAIVIGILLAGLLFTISLILVETFTEIIKIPYIKIKKNR